MACSNPSTGPGPFDRIWRRTIQEGQPPIPVAVDRDDVLGRMRFREVGPR